MLGKNGPNRMPTLSLNVWLAEATVIDAENKARPIVEAIAIFFTVKYLRGKVYRSVSINRNLYREIIT